MEEGRNQYKASVVYPGPSIMPSAGPLLAPWVLSGKGYVYRSMTGCQSGGRGGCSTTKEHHVAFQMDEEATPTPGLYKAVIDNPSCMASTSTLDYGRTLPSPSVNREWYSIRCSQIPEPGRPVVGTYTMCIYYYLHYHHIPPCPRDIEYSLQYSFCANSIIVSAADSPSSPAQEPRYIRQPCDNCKSQPDHIWAWLISRETW